MSNAEKLHEAQRKFKALRDNVRGRILERETPLLDLLSDRVNGSALQAQKQDLKILEAIQELKKENEKLESENKQLLEELERKKRESFAARIG